MWLPWIRFKAVIAGVFGSEMAEGIDMNRLNAVCAEISYWLHQNSWTEGWSKGIENFPHKIQKSKTPEDRIRLARGRLQVMSTGNNGWSDIVIGVRNHPQELNREGDNRFRELSEELRNLCASDIYWLKFKNQPENP